MEKLQLKKFVRSSIVEENSHEQFLHNVQKKVFGDYYPRITHNIHGCCFT